MSSKISNQTEALFSDKSYSKEEEELDLERLDFEADEENEDENESLLKYFVEQSNQIDIMMMDMDLTNEQIERFKRTKDFYIGKIIECSSEQKPKKETYTCCCCQRDCISCGENYK